MTDDPFDRIRQMLASVFGEDMAQQAVDGLRQAGIDADKLLSGDPSQIMAMMPMQVFPSVDEEPEPVDWALVSHIAHLVVSNHGDPMVTGSDATQVKEALQVADLWLDVVTDFPPAPGPRHAWSRDEWISNTIDTWRAVFESVAGAAQSALQDELGAILPGSDDESNPMAAMIQPSMGRLSSMVMGGQTGTAVGELALKALSSTDAGLPLNRSAGTALVVANVEEFAHGLEADLNEVRLFLAVREAATARLYAHAPWLRAMVLQAVTDYAAQLHIDSESVRDALSSVNPADMSNLDTILSGKIFSQGEGSEDEQRAQRTVAWLLATVEGWVDEVTFQATLPHLPHAVALSEMMRRHRAHGGPAEQMFASLMGMNIRPAHARSAAELWRILTQEEGVAGRDAYWDHPDVMPTADEIMAPLTFRDQRADRQHGDRAIDAELQSLLDGTLGYDGDANTHDG